MTSQKSPKITLDIIRQVQQSIANDLTPTPLIRATRLSQLKEAEILLKLETMTPSGCCIDRGIINCLQQLTTAQRQQGVIVSQERDVAYSIGLFAKKFSTKVTAVLPTTMPLTQVQELRDLDVDVILHGENSKAATQHAQQLADESQRLFIDGYENPQMIAGYGTIGLEICQSLKTTPPDIILVPVKGGALISPIALACKAHFPQTQIIGVQPESACELYHYFKGKNRAASSAMADNMFGAIGDSERLSSFPSSIAKEIIPRLVDDLVVVSDEYISRALLHLIEQVKVFADITASTVLAAILEGKVACRGKRVVAVITGGNIDIHLLSRLIDRGLLKSGRLSRVNILISDQPGALEQLAHLFAANRANILQVNHDRIFSRTPLGSARCDLTVETRGPDHVQQLISALEARGYSFTITQ